ncbi:MAG: serine--tRNA ligase [Candidatus Kapaibacteriota bacterium]
MLDIKLIRENAAFVKENLANKNHIADTDHILTLDEVRRNIIKNVEVLKAERNVATLKVAELKKAKQNADEIILKMKEVSDRIKEFDDELRDVESRLNIAMQNLPNVTHSSVPQGKDAENNVVIRGKGETNPSYHKLDHIEICKKLGIVDFERGAKVTGSGFHFYTDKGARLERALINYFLDTHTDKNGYREMMPPFVVNSDSMYGTGQLPKMHEDMYHAANDNLYLIPTAEVPLTNYYNGEVLDGLKMPIKVTGYSPCFRREAGSYGRDVRGLLRVHQFNKVELVKFVQPEKSFDELEAMVSEVENILIELGLTYRVLLLCSGDTSFASTKTYDLEVWAESEQKWLEVSSCSNFVDFQARRANIRYKKDPNSKPETCHTLNGSGLATPRIMVALVEKYFDGVKLIIPEVLRKYTGFSEIHSI